MKRIRLLALCAIFFPAVWDPPTPGQEVRRAKPSLQYEVTVTRKLLHVIVTDRNGKPVTDLRKDEFVIFDNGQQKTITEFENHTLSLPGEERRPPAAVPAPLEKAPEPAAPLMTRTFFLLFDLVFADAGGMLQARQAALRFLENELKAEDRVAVLSFLGGRSLNILHRPDGDRPAARRAVESIGLHSLMPIAPIRPVDDSQPKIATAATANSHFGPAPTALIGEARAGRIVAGNFIWAMESLAQALRYEPGQKVLVLYSNGLHPAYLSRGEFAGNDDIGRAYQDLCHQLTAANTSVYAVNTEENTYLVNQTPESRKGVSSLREITRETGGRFLGDIYAVPDHLEKIDTLTGAYYVLGFPIVESWDGRYHKIRVKVTRPGCEVGAQQGYFNAKPFSAYSELEKKIHLVDLALSERPLSQEPIRFAMQALPWASSPPNDVRFIAEIPVEGLGDVSGPRLEITGLVFDDLDELVDTRRAELDLSRPEIHGRTVFYQADFSAPPGHFKCRLVLRNMETGLAAVAAASTVVPKPDPNSPLLFPPLFLVSGKPAMYLGGAGGSSRGAGADVFRSFPVDPEKFAPLLEEPLPPGREILAIVRCVMPEKLTDEVSLAASLKNEASGGTVVIPLARISEKKDKDGRSFFVRFNVPAVPRGVYIVEMSAGVQGLASRFARKIRIE